MCARSVVHDAAALAYGADPVAPVTADPGVLGAQYACQQAIGQAASGYAATRLQRRIAGDSREAADALALPALDAIAATCAVPVAQDAGGVVLPAVGAQCATALGPPGSPVDVAELQGCLHQLLAVWVDRIGPDPLPLRPNIVFIVTDDQRWDTTDGTHALPGEVVMPSVRSEIAGEGVEFTNGFDTTPLCCPSRATILSSRYSHAHGIQIGGASELPEFDESSTFAIWLQAAGYRTGLFGKYLNGYGNLWTPGSPPIVPPGWDHWRAMSLVGYFGYKLVENGVEVPYGDAPDDYSTDVLRDQTIAFIADSVARGQPFLAYYAPIAPHEPAIPAPRHAGAFAGLAPWRPASFNEADASDKPGYIKNRPLADPAQVDALRKAQLTTLLAVDEAVAAILQTLRELGVADDTLVVFTSDNGFFWGEHRLSSKHRPYEEAIRAPYMIRYPRLAPLPRRDAHLVTNLDFAPTFTELAGAIRGPNVVGTSLVGLLDGTAPAWRADFLTEGFPGGLEWVTVRESRWKYTEYNPVWGTKSELYDLEVDPLELENVAASPANAARVAAMRARARELRPGWPDDLATFFIP
jgi:arylsulfatase A-like enzyme